MEEGRADGRPGGPGSERVRGAGSPHRVTPHRTEQRPHPMHVGVLRQRPLAGAGRPPARPRAGRAAPRGRAVLSSAVLRATRISEPSRKCACRSGRSSTTWGTPMAASSKRRRLQPGFAVGAGVLAARHVHRHRRAGIGAHVVGLVQHLAPAVVPELGPAPAGPPQREAVLHQLGEHALAVRRRGAGKDHVGAELVAGAHRSVDRRVAAGREVARPAACPARRRAATAALARDEHEVVGRRDVAHHGRRAAAVAEPVDPDRTALPPQVGDQRGGNLAALEHEARAPAPSAPRRAPAGPAGRPAAAG